MRPPSHSHSVDFARDTTPAVARHRQLLAIGCMGLGVLVMTAMDALVKGLVEAQYSVLQLMALRGAIISAGLFLWSLWRTQLRSLRTDRLPAHTLRAIIGFFAPTLFFVALGKLPLADTTVLFFAAPFLMTALAVPVLTEHVPRRHWLLIGAGFIGVVIAAQPSRATFHWSLLLPLGSAVSYAIMAIMGRWMRNTESVFGLVFYFNLGHALIAACALPFVWQELSLGALGLFAACAVMAAVGQFLFTYALRIGPVGLVAPFEYTGLVWSAVVGYFAFGELPTLPIAVGAAIIGLSGVALARDAGRAAPSAESPPPM